MVSTQLGRQLSMEYCSGLNPAPFVILPNLGIIYVKELNHTLEATAGCHIDPQMISHIKQELHSHIMDGSDVALQVHHGLFMFRVYNNTGDLVVAFSLWGETWDYFKQATVKIQRFFRARLWRVRRPTHLEHVKAFQGSDTAKKLPTDVFSKIVEYYFQAPIIRILTATPMQRMEITSLTRLCA